jgi:hypothetical protein
VNFEKLFKTIDVLMGVGDLVKGRNAAPPPDAGPLSAQPDLGGPIERTLTNVLVAALKEAFDRDHARLEIERAQVEEEKRRAEEAMRMELRRLAAERELGRLRLLSGAALVGWIVSVVLLVMRLGHSTPASAIVLALGCLLPLASLGAAFTAQGRINVGTPESGNSGVTALWLLLVGLACSAGSLLF